jgi:hypothetical protein
MSERRTVKVFVSSPGDVVNERVVMERVLQRLQGEFQARLRIEPVFWEHEPVRATADYQSQFPLASSCDIVVCILWSRLGTRLPDEFGTKPDGSPWRSGTEFEFATAAESYREKKLPDLLVYRKTAEWRLPDGKLPDDPQEFQRLWEQRQALNEFLDHWFGRPDSGFKAGFTTFVDEEDFESKIVVHLRKLLEEKLEGGDASSVEAPSCWWREGSPFRGLEPFESRHAPIYFGRTRASFAVRNLLARRAAEGAPFVLVLGASGSGKSSLLRAGVAPTLTFPGVVHSVDAWRVAVVRPGDAAHPCEALAAGLADAEALPELAELGHNRAQLLRLMREAPQVLDQPIQAALRLASQRLCEKAPSRWRRPPVLGLLLLLDQLEQLFTIEGVDDAARRQFVQSTAALARSGAVWVVAAVRSDFYHRCLEMPELAELKGEEGQYDLLPPTPDELRQMIVEPARAAGLRFEESAEGERLDGLLQERAAGNPDALPLLEFALDQLYRRAAARGSNVLALGDYHALGGLEGAVARRAEETLDRLPEDVQAAFGDVMSMAVSVSPQGRAAVPVDLDRFPAGGPARRLIDALVAERLMTTDSRPDGTPTARLVHDALLNRWEHLRKWVADNEEMLRVRGRVEGACQSWLESNRDPAYLLAEGKPLVDGGDLLQRHGAHLDPTLVDFVRASERKSAARRRARRVGVAAVAAVFVALATGAGAWISQEKSAREREQAARERTAHLLEDYGEASTRIVHQIQGTAGVDPEDTISNVAVLSGLFDQLAEQKGGAPDIHAKKGDLTNATAAVYLDLGDVAKAEQLALAADDAYAQALQGGGDVRRWRLARGRNLKVLVLALLAQHRFVDAERVADDLSRLAESLREAHPDDLENLNLSCSGNRLKGFCRSWMGDAYGAREHYRRAMEDLHKASEPFGEKDAGSLSEVERETLQLLARTRLDHAEACDEWETPAAVESWRREALGIAEKLAAAAPSSSEFAVLSADARMALQGGIRDERPEEARRLLELVHQSAKAYTELNPRHLQWHRLRLYSSFILGDMRSRDGASAEDERRRLQEGVERLKGDLALAEEVCKRCPENRAWWNMARATRDILGIYYLQSAGHETDPVRRSEFLQEGRRLRERSVQDLKDGVEKDPDNWVLLFSLCSTLEPNRWNLWIDYHQRQRAREPDNPSWTAGVAEGLVGRGFGLPKKSDSDLREAVELFDSLSARAPEEWQWASRAAEATRQRYLVAARSGDDALKKELLHDGLARYERLAESAPEWKRHHERLFEFRMQRVGDARKREKWPETAAAVRSALDGLQHAYSSLGARPVDLLSGTGPVLALVRAAVEEAAPTNLGLYRKSIAASWYLTRTQGAMPRELQIYRRVDGVFDIIQAAPKFVAPNHLDDGDGRQEARATLRLARRYLDELREMEYAHPVLDVWREAVETTLAGLPAEAHPAPAELQAAYDGMDFRGVAEGWVRRSADARDLLAWLDWEVRLAGQASWRRPALWTLLFLSDEAAEALLDVETLDSAAFGAARFALAPETIALLQGIAAVHGDAWTCASLPEHGPPSDDILSALHDWIKSFGSQFSGLANRGAFASRDNFTIAAGVASVDDQSIAAAASRIEQCSSLMTLAVQLANFGLTEEGRKRLEEIRSDEAAPSRARAYAGVIAAEDLLWKGDYAGAREILAPLAAGYPDRKLILQDLVLLELMERASSGSDPGEFDPLSDLRIRLLDARYPEHPISRLLVAWWSAQYRGAQDALEKVAAIAQQPGYGESWLVHDVLARVAEATGKTQEAKAHLETALTKIPENDESLPCRVRLKDRLAGLEGQE